MAGDPARKTAQSIRQVAVLRQNNNHISGIIGAREALCPVDPVKVDLPNL